MKIYTKTGDSGTTALLGGARVSKAHLRIDAYGTVDELNSFIGLLSDQPVNEKRRAILKEIQDRLFTLGAELASEPGKNNIVKPDMIESDIILLEKEMDAMELELEPLKNFILPGGHQSVSYAHLARTVCRRAERICTALKETSPVAPIVIQYLNRLSDYFFVLGRKMAKELDIVEVKWEPRQK
ncbi:MAG: cob(I)alamin adenosyltransferase [Roseivirga sp.]